LNGSYALVRYLPYPEREEFINVGVLVVSGDQQKCFFEFRDKFPKAISQSNIPIRSDMVMESIKLIKSRVTERTRSASQAVSELSHDLANSIQITALRPCSFDYPEEFLHKTYKKFVEPLHELSEVREIDRMATSF
jgi:hypothetical protein